MPYCGDWYASEEDNGFFVLSDTKASSYELYRITGCYDKKEKIIMLIENSTTTHGNLNDPNDANKTIVNEKMTEVIITNEEMKIIIALLRSWGITIEQQEVRHGNK